MKTAYAVIERNADSFIACIEVRSGSVRVRPEGYKKSSYDMGACIADAISLLYGYIADNSCEAGGVLNYTPVQENYNKGGTMEKDYEKRSSGVVEVVKNERAVPE